MHKGVVLLVFLALLPSFICFVSAQFHNTQPIDFTNIGSNFETICSGEICNTTVYSYDKYFNREDEWEQIDENWNNCGEDLNYLKSTLSI